MAATMHAVKSSNLSHVGHDGNALLVTFTSGKTYRYDGVPAKHLAALCADKSPGSYFAKNIRAKYTGELQEE